MSYKPTPKEEAFFDQLAEFIAELRDSEDPAKRWYVKGLFDGMTVGSDFPPEVVRWGISKLFPTEIVEDMIREVFKDG